MTSRFFGLRGAYEVSGWCGGIGSLLCSVSVTCQDKSKLTYFSRSVTLEPFFQKTKCKCFVNPKYQKVFNMKGGSIDKEEENNVFSQTKENKANFVQIIKTLKKYFQESIDDKIFDIASLVVQWYLILDQVSVSRSVLKRFRTIFSDSVRAG